MTFAVIWGIVLIIYTLILGWLGQSINALFPDLAQRLGLNERQEELDSPLTRRKT